MVRFCIQIYGAESLQYKVLFIQTNVLTNGNAIVRLKIHTDRKNRQKCLVQELGLTARLNNELTLNLRLYKCDHDISTSIVCKSVLGDTVVMGFINVKTCMH